MRDKTPMRSKIRALLDDGGQLTNVDEVVLNDHALIRLRIISEDPDKKRAMNIDLEAYEEKLRRISVETDEQLRERIEFMRKQRQSPDHITHIFWLDPKLNYAIRQYELHRAGQVHWRYSCDDYVQVPDRDLFFPRKVKNESFHTGRDPLAVEKEPINSSYEVTEISSARVPDAAFVPKITTSDAELTDFREDPDHPMTNRINEDGIPPRRP